MQREIAAIPVSMLRNGKGNFNDPMQECINIGGRLPGIFFHF